MFIETANLTDIGALTTLYQALTTEMHTLQPTNYQEKSSPDFFTWKMMVEDNRQVIYITRDQNQITSFCHVTTAQTSPSNLFISHQFAYVTALYVHPNYRRQGLATALLAQARTWQNEKQLAFLELTVLGNNQSALQLYQKLGFVTQNQTLRQV